MNKVYIVIDIDNAFFIELDFEKNIFILNNVIYKFKLIEHYKLCIYWSNNNYDTYITDNSFIFYSNILLKNQIKLIYLKNDDWNNNNVIINFNKNILIKIDTEWKESKEHKEYKIEINNNFLKIYWNHIIELFIKKNDFYYIKNDKNNNKNLILNKNIPEIHIFIHICCIENWIEIFNEQINLIKSSGLYNIINKIHLGILSDLNNINLSIFNDPKFNIIYIDSRNYLYEIYTINSIKSFCERENKEIYILYIHTKGVRKMGNDYVVKSWRNMMEYFLINNYSNCIDYLEYYDTLGCNLINSKCVTSENASINQQHFYHYSGNFWWSKKSYIDKLNYIPLNLSIDSDFTRFKAENWILSNYPDAIIGIIYQDNTNYHPYFRYVFDHYKKIDFYVNKLL